VKRPPRGTLYSQPGLAGRVFVFSGPGKPGFNDATKVAQNRPTNHRNRWAFRNRCHAIFRSQGAAGASTKRETGATGRPSVLAHGEHRMRIVP
jgi:hypothetical protein